MAEMGLQLYWLLKNKLGKKTTPFLDRDISDFILGELQKQHTQHFVQELSTNYCKLLDLSYSHLKYYCPKLGKSVG